MPADQRKLKNFLCMLLFLQLLFSGCHSFSKLETKYLISLHELASDDQADSQLSRTVSDIQQTRTVRINTYAFLDAKCFYQAELIPSDDNIKCGLRLYFDRFGHNTLLQAAAQQKGRPFAVLVDGFFIGLSNFPNRFERRSSLDLEPLWSAMEAEQIVHYIPKNYRHFN